MDVTLTFPATLWLLLAVPFVWIARRFARTNFNPRQQVLQAVVRSVLLALLALALAQPVISFGSSRLSVVYVVDVSHSVSSAAIVAAADRIDALEREVRPSHHAIVVFGVDTAVVDDTDAVRRIAEADPGAPDEGPVRRDGSDLDRALREARAELASGHLPRLVLFSDGRQTAGQAESAAVRLAFERVPVFTEAMSPRDIADTWVESVDVPERMAAGSLVSVGVTVGSQRPLVARVGLREGDELLASRQVELQAGATVVALDAAFDQAGAHALEAFVEAPGDPLAANNQLTREALVGPRTPVLYVEGVEASARYLSSALERTGFDVTTAAPGGLPASADDLDAYDVVILSDVARPDIPDAQMLALGEYVERRGGGLLVAGGEAVFGEGPDGGEGGYRETELERLTPVTFERKDEPEVALIIVLDKSWSMAGVVMELCKAAAQAAIDVLTDEQSVGVVTFNDGLNWDVPLRNVGLHRQEINDAIRAIEPSGHTLIFPAVEQAYVALKDARARAKHVVLLSDGRSYPDDYETLLRRMVDAKITVSSIAVGPAADRELLTNIARWGRGRSYVVEDAREVPQIFVKEAKDAATPAFDEGAITPVVKAEAFLEGVDLSGVPSLRGRTATVVKDTALELLTTEDGDPLLAFWPIGLGRSAVFASDVKDRWASDWLGWRGYGPFFAAVLRGLERQRRSPVVLDVVERPIQNGARSIGVSLEVRDPQGNYRDLLSPVVRVQSSGGDAVDVSLRQTGPGRYEGSVSVEASNVVSLSVGMDEPGIRERLVIPDLAAEYRFRPADQELLEALALTTGGAYGPAADAIERSEGASRVARRALWPWLVALALVCWLGDVLLRRVRVFEQA
ncbi:MAG TPA: VWA domain-containing protein [Vicinamibacterales bacterium]|nr:VWA domain-containing protein [Vicinamibacterales bacterium]